MTDQPKTQVQKTSANLGHPPTAPQAEIGQRVLPVQGSAEGMDYAAIP